MKRLLSIIIILFLCSLKLSAQNIVAAEYFFDTDPGTGNGTSITVPSPSDSVNLNISLPTSGFGLTPGPHKVYVRTKDANGKWSLYEGKSFSIVTNLVAAEYFFDTDPGKGNGTPISVSTSDSINVTTSLPTAGFGLVPGPHKVYVRTKDETNKWSLYEGQSFSIAIPIVAAEYFFDTDPGKGNGTPLSVPASDSINVTTTLPTAGFNLTAGPHKAYVRTRDINNKWSLYEAQSFTISLPPLPVTITGFTAINRDCHININWSVAQELNLSKYEVEASKDGIVFQKVCEVAAQGRTDYTNSFNLTDNLKAPTIQVRLKCINLDGSFKYSNIALISGICTGKTLPVVYSYPNPVYHNADHIIIATQEGLFNGNYELTLSDMSGKVYAVREVVLTNVSSFPFDVRTVTSAGKYLVSIRKTDGSVNAVVQFEKL